MPPPIRGGGITSCAVDTTKPLKKRAALNNSKYTASIDPRSGLVKGLATVIAGQVKIQFASGYATINDYMKMFDV